jgi:tetratricopeptide (TPR) repeat protein
MKKKLCLLAALCLTVAGLSSCAKIEARTAIRDGNAAYEKEDYRTALFQYTKARTIDPSFPDLDRMIGYSEIGLYIPDEKSPANEKHADTAIVELNKYLKKRPEDRVARDALINMYLNANRTDEAIAYFRNYLSEPEHRNDLEAVKSIATLYAKKGDFNESMNWYEKITLIDSKNPESYYILGVVYYEKVAKNPPADSAERMAIIEKGKAALQHSIDMKPDYFESMAYLNLLWRQQALVETDPVKAQQDVAQAVQIRDRAIEIIKQRKAAGSAKKS